MNASDLKARYDEVSRKLDDGINYLTNLANGAGMDNPRYTDLYSRWEKLNGEGKELEECLDWLNVTPTTPAQIKQAIGGMREAMGEATTPLVRQAYQEKLSSLEQSIRPVPVKDELDEWLMEVAA